MATILHEKFTDGSSIRLSMLEVEGELYVFHNYSDGIGYKVYKYDLNAYDMGNAMAIYNEITATTYERINKAE